MLRRHPHVFGDTEIPDAAAQTVAWEEHKAAERRAAAAAAGRLESALDGVGEALPALTRAVKLQRRAARVGFEWRELRPILDKISEEIDELRRELDAGGKPAPVADELGDLLFAVVNLARRAEADPEQALRAACRKFERRFRRVEALLRAAGRTPQAAGLEEMEALWNQAKKEEG
jgi:ATP diphosphatase